MDEKKCQNCRYFSQHYAFTACQFRAINCGHCICTDLKLKESEKRNKLNLDCEFWEPKQIKKEEVKQSIKDYMSNVFNQINTIVQYIEAENENKPER